MPDNSVRYGGFELVRRLTDALRTVMWPDGGPVPAMAVVAKPAPYIAELGVPAHRAEGDQ